MLAAGLVLAQGATEEVSPIGKVLEMIGGLQAKVIKEGEEAQKVYGEFAEWCEDRSKDLGFEIKTAKSEVESLAATIAEETASIASAETKIEELSASIATNEADLKAATEIRAKENKDFVAEESELMEIVNMIERAIGILERELSKGGASMMQVKSANNVEQALVVMVQAAVINSQDAHKLTAFLQARSNAEDSDSEMGAPAAAAYEGQSGGIVDTMQDLMEKANAELDECRKKEEAALHNYDMLKQSLTDEIEFANKDMAEAKKGMAASSEKKSTAEGDLTVTKKDLEADIASKGELHHDCMGKAQDFEAETKSRGEELAALAQAKKIIEETTGGAESQSYAFVQVASMAKAGSRMQLARFEVVRIVRDLAKKHHATALAQLASRMDATLRIKSNARGFDKVRTMIADMISKLEEEAEADATKKAYCDKEMGETEAKKSDKEDELEKLTTKIEQMTAESAKLKEEVQALQAALAELTRSQAEMDKLRKEENAAYTKNKGDMEMGLNGVKKALAVLKEYYAKGDKAHSSGDGASTGIIGMLEVCESDFSKDLAEIVSVEEAAAAAYEQETKDNEIEKTTKTKDVEYKTKEAKSLDKSSSETTSDADSVKAELDAVLEYYSKIQSECVAKPESYEDRVARRTAEIAGLKDALNILESETALVQTSSHRALRGIHRIA
jgi:chromosome segregation ATPase